MKLQIVEYINSIWKGLKNHFSLTKSICLDIELIFFFRSFLGYSNDKNNTNGNSDNLDLYAGKYQNRMFGNITINYNATSDQLSMVYGKTGYFYLERTTTKDTFLIVALGGLPYYMNHADNYKSDLYRYLYFNRTKAHKRGKEFESITIPDFDHNVHPVFKRHLEPVVVGKQDVEKQDVEKQDVEKQDVEKQDVENQDVEKHFESKVYSITNGQGIIRAFCVLILGGIINALVIVALH